MRDEEVATDLELEYKLSWPS